MALSYVIWIIIILIFIALCCYAWLIDKVHDFLVRKKRDMSNGKIVEKNQKFYEDHPSAKDYVGKEHTWNPTYKLAHNGVRLMNIPFDPDETEVFYLEDEYDDNCNRFIIYNYDLICAKFAENGFRFVYLPYLKVDRKMMAAMLDYRFPDGNDVDASALDDCNGLKSNFLLDYMVHPENREHIKPGFAWYGRKWNLVRTQYQFDYITFDGKEASENIDGILDEILLELGHTRIFRAGFNQEIGFEDDDSADQHFDEETKKILDEVRVILDKIRMKGISEAAIAQYLKPTPSLSHIRITPDFHIFLDDFKGIEIKMEPLVKAVFLLFLRHKEGIKFKDLPDYRKELEIIYRAIKQKKNDIDQKLEDKTFSPKISENIKKITDPFDNSINEKCTRIKEAFLIHFHDTIAEHYYIRGCRGYQKVITLPENLIIWEDGK